MPWLQGTRCKTGLFGVTSCGNATPFLMSASFVSVGVGVCYGLDYGLFPVDNLLAYLLPTYLTYITKYSRCISRGWPDGCRSPLLLLMFNPFWVKGFVEGVRGNETLNPKRVV